MRQFECDYVYLRSWTPIYKGQRRGCGVGFLNCFKKGSSNFFHTVRSSKHEGGVQKRGYHLFSTKINLSDVIFPSVCMCLFTYTIWDYVFKNGPGKICGTRPLKNLKGYSLP